MTTTDEDDSTTTTGEIRRGEAYGGRSPQQRERAMYERLIASVEPSLKGDPARLQVYIKLYERELLAEPRLFASRVAATWNEAAGAVILDGYVQFEENKVSLDRLFHYLDFEMVQNNVEVLPSAKLGTKRFALVTAPRSFLFDKPSEPHERLDEALLGEPIYLLREAEQGFFLCASQEGYIGVIDGAHITRVDERAFTAYQSGAQGTLRSDFEKGETTVYTGSRLKCESAPGADPVVLRLPGGGTIEVPAGQVLVRKDEPNQLALAAIAAAKEKLGSKYVWGGVTSDGVDCSGLVQSSYKAQGVNLARDAYMQAYAGTLVGTRWYRAGMRPGDLLYFIGRGGRITHTAIYLGNNEMIEASGTVKLTSIDPNAPNYSRQRDTGLILAKRLFE